MSKNELVKHYVTYDSRDRCIWGSGLTVQESKDDARKYIDDYAQLKGSLVQKAQIKRRLVTKPATKRLVDYIDQYGGDIAENWKLVNGVVTTKNDQK